MEKQTLPNSTLIIILAILSILSSCCGGIFGIIFSIIALVLCRKATKIYTEDPEIYSNYQNVRIGKILAIIGLVLGLVFLITLLVNLFFLGGMEEMGEFQNEFMRGFNEGYSQQN